MSLLFPEPPLRFAGSPCLQGTPGLGGHPWRGWASLSAEQQAHHFCSLNLQSRKQQTSNPDSCNTAVPVSPGTNTTLQQGQECWTSYFPQGKHCLCVCSSLNPAFFCALEAICSFFIEFTQSPCFKRALSSCHGEATGPQTVHLCPWKKGNFSKAASRQQGLLVWHPAQGRQGFSLM